MALDGGGGGGGGLLGVSNSFTGPATGLEVYGDFAAAYTGLQAANTTQFTVLEFTTGNYLFVGEFQLNGAIDQAAPPDIEQTTATISLNGAKIVLITSGNGQIDASLSVRQPLLIPAYTVVTVEFDMEGTNANRFASGSLVGRIYRE